MRVPPGWLIAAGLLFTSVATPARGEYSRCHHNDLSRWIGYGWSEGYHAYDECPPPCRPPMHLKWQPLIRPASAGKVPLEAPLSPAEVNVPAREELPPPLPAESAAESGQSTSLRRAIQQRRGLKPSEQARPGVVPIPRDPDAIQEPGHDVLPTSAIEVAPAANRGRYPLMR